MAITAEQKLEDLSLDLEEVQAVLRRMGSPKAWPTQEEMAGVDPAVLQSVKASLESVQGILQRQAHRLAALAHVQRMAGEVPLPLVGRADVSVPDIAGRDL